MEKQTVTNNHTLTAVEWFWILLPEDISKEYFDLFEQAKQMEKEQIEKAIDNALNAYGIIKKD